LCYIFQLGATRLNTRIGIGDKLSPDASGAAGRYDLQRELPMPTSLDSALERELPILFANIGWAERYDGTEPINGNFSGLKENPKEGWERKAFVKAKNGPFQCGIGKGKLPPKLQSLHVIFVSRDPSDNQLKAVGVYAMASVENPDDDYAWVRTENAMLFACGLRPKIEHWHGNQGVRRWGWRNGVPGQEWPGLQLLFNQIVERIVTGNLHEVGDPADANDDVLNAIEGIAKQQLINHRKRESSLRKAKILEVFTANKGRLVCEVPKCKFDFVKRYGALGGGYAHVHHKKPLGDAPASGQQSTLEDLAVVCANCHAMIHRNGLSRPLDKLIP
jgi:hypothetical protein